MELHAIFLEENCSEELELIVPGKKGQRKIEQLNQNFQKLQVEIPGWCCLF